ncbi:MAG: DUF748 domain-containing protein [Bacteroidota bacterium]
MKKILIIITIIILVLIIVSLIIAPPIARTYLVKNSPELIGRQIALEKLKMNYFRMSVELRDFVLYEDDGQTPFVSFDQLYVNLAPWHLFYDDLVVQDFLLDGLKVNIIQYDTVFNFDSMLAFFESDSTGDADTLQQGQFEFHLSNLEMKNGEFYYLDSTVGEDIEMQDLNLFVPYIGWDQENKSDAGLKFSFANGGYFQSAFQMDPVSGHFIAEVKVDNLDLATFLGYATHYVALDSLQGSFDTDLRIMGNVNFIDSLSIDGWADLDKLDITSNGNKELVFVDSLHCKLELLQPMMNRYLIDTVKINKPIISFDLYDSTNNFIALFADMSDPSGAKDEIENQGDTAVETDPYALYYAINSLEVLDGALDFTDYRYADTFNYDLSELKMAVDSISSTAAWIDATAAMILNNKGKLIATLGLDPSNPLELDLEYSISEFRLSDLNIYTNHYISHDIVFGDLYYNSETRIRSGQLESDNKLTIRDIEINKIKGGLMTLPLKLALFIVKDKDGDAVLDIPLRGDLNDPELNIGKLVWNTFKRFIGRIATAPYHFLSGLVSADPSDLKDIKYDFADTVFTHKKQRQLDLLMELEQKKEGLDIQLVYFVDMDLEKEAIAIKQKGEEFRDTTSLDYHDHEAEFLNYLRTRAMNDSVDIADAAVMLCDAFKLDSAAVYLSQYRIQQLQSYITDKNDSSKIRVHGYHPDAPKNVGASPYFQLEYAIMGEDDGD